MLSLGEFDELKSHLFSVHFSDRFLYKKKTDLYVGIWNNFTKLLCNREFKRKQKLQ